MLTRYEFIGLQDGDTVFGHRYAHTKSEMFQWLQDQHIHKFVWGYAGFVPEELALDYQFIAAMFQVIGKNNTALLHHMNRLALDGVVVVEDLECVGSE